VISKKKTSLHDMMLRRHGRWRACSEAKKRGYFWFQYIPQCRKPAKKKIKPECFFCSARMLLNRIE